MIIYNSLFVSRFGGCEGMKLSAASCREVNRHQGRLLEGNLHALDLKDRR